MKRVAVVLFVLISAGAYGETLDEGLNFPFNDTKKDSSQETKTLFGNRDYSLSGYGGMFMTTSALENGDGRSYFTGWHGAAIINKTFVLGLSGCSLDYPTDRKDFSGESYNGDFPRIQLHYGGLYTGMNFNPEDMINLSLTTTIGGGALFFTDSRDYDDDDSSHYDKGAGIDPFYVFEPALLVHINITRWMRAGAGVSYRFTKGIDNEEISDRDLNNWSLMCSLDFGWF